MLEGLKDYVDSCWSWAEAVAPQPMGEKGAALNTILTLVIAGVALVIGVFVYGEIMSSMNLEPENTANNSVVENIAADIWGAYGMTPIILIVLVAGAIIPI